MYEKMRSLRCLDHFQFYRLACYHHGLFNPLIVIIKSLFMFGHSVILRYILFFGFDTLPLGSWWHPKFGTFSKALWYFTQRCILHWIGRCARYKPLDNEPMMPYAFCFNKLLCISLLVAAMLRERVHNL